MRFSKQPSCFALRSEQGDKFSVALVFLKLVRQNGEDEKKDRNARKRTQSAGQRKQTKETTATTNEPINYRETENDYDDGRNR